VAGLPQLSVARARGCRRAGKSSSRRPRQAGLRLRRLFQWRRTLQGHGNVRVVVAMGCQVQSGPPTASSCPQHAITHQSGKVSLGWRSLRGRGWLAGSEKTASSAPNHYPNCCKGSPRAHAQDLRELSVSQQSFITPITTSCRVIAENRFSASAAGLSHLSVSQSTPWAL